MSCTYDEKKAKIEEAAKKTFARYGYSKTTLEDIAKEVGMKKNSLYYYFGSKDELFDEMLKAVTDSIYNRLKEKVDAVEGAWEKVVMFFKESSSFKIDSDAFEYLSKSSYMEMIEIIEKGDVNIFDVFNEFGTSLLEMAKKEGAVRKDLDSLWFVVKTRKILLAIEYRFFSTQPGEFLKDSFQIEESEDAFRYIQLALDGIKVCK